MAIYPYRNAKGERREISASMKAPPPGELVFGRRGYRAAKPTDKPDQVWTRVYAECLPRIDVKDYEVRPMSGDRNAPPISRSAMPINAKGKPETMWGRTVYRHKSGAITDNQGRPYIRNKSDIDAANGAKADEGVVQVWE